MLNINKKMMKYNLFILILCIGFSAMDLSPRLTDIEVNTALNSLNGNITKNTTHEADLPLLYSKISDKGYYVENILRANFYEAMYFCKYHGMELLSIISKDEEDSILEVLQGLEVEAGMYFLTSARGMKTDRNNPSQTAWVWLSSGKPMRYKNWHSTPSGSESEGCMKMRLSNRVSTFNRPEYSLDWYAHNCDHQIYFICETI